MRQARLNNSVAKQTILGSAAIYCPGLNDDGEDEEDDEDDKDEDNGGERDESCVHVAAACIVQESNHANVFSLGCRASDGRGEGEGKVDCEVYS